MVTTDAAEMLPVEQPKAHGRRPGVGNKHSTNGVRRLNQLDFDPIERMVLAFNELEREIAEMNTLKEQISVTLDGAPKRKYSSMAHVALLAQKQKLLADLLRYGYARVPETLQLEQKKLPGITINLTSKSPSPFKPPEITDV